MANEAEQYSASSQPSSQETLLSFAHSLKIPVPSLCKQAEAGLPEDEGTWGVKIWHSPAEVPQETRPQPVQQLTPDLGLSPDKTSPHQRNHTEESSPNCWATKSQNHPIFFFYNLPTLKHDKSLLTQSQKLSGWEMCNQSNSWSWGLGNPQVRQIGAYRVASQGVHGDAESRASPHTSSGKRRAVKHLNKMDISCFPPSVFLFLFFSFFQIDAERERGKEV